MTIGVREGVILLIALVAIYMLFVLLRMRHLRQRRVEEFRVPTLGGTAEGRPEPAKSAESKPEAPSVAASAWDQAAAGLAADALRQGLEQEIAQLRDEVDAIRGELAALRGDMLQEMAHLRATQSVSPVYGDAMQMAAAGYEPAMIAERCGIARAEAELVVALAKSQER